MARTVIAVFESVYVAKKALRELLEAGFPRERIDLSTERLSESSLEKPEAIRSEAVLDELHAGSSIGAGIGGSLGFVGGLLSGLGVVHLPLLALIAAGLHAASVQTPAFLAAGSLSTLAETAAFCGAGMLAGALTGSLLSGLVGLGIPEQEILQYAKTVRRNPVTVMVVADWDTVDGTLEVLEHYDPLEIRQKAIEWQKAGERERKLAERALHVKVTEQDRPR